MKVTAYKELVELAKPIVPGCSVDFVKKKTDCWEEILEETSRKWKPQCNQEVMLIPIHTKPWHYKLLLLLTDQEEVKASTFMLDSSSVEETGSKFLRESEQEQTTATVC